MSKFRDRVRSYGLAVTVTFFALFVMLALNPWLKMAQTPFLLFFGAITLSAWFGGMGPGIASTALSALLSFYFFLPPAYHLTGNLIVNSRLLLFVGQGFLISYLCGALRTAQARTSTSLQQLRASEAEREQLLRELEIERLRLETILRQMPAGLLIADAVSGKLVLANAQIEEILGHAGQLNFSRSDDDRLLSSIGYHLDGRHYQPQDWPLIRSLQTGEIVSRENIEIERDDGTRIAIEVNSAPIRDVQGQIVAAVAIFQDITASKQREAERNAMLIQIQETNALLAQRNQELDRFAYIVSHDLKAPLRAIANLSAWIEEDLAGQLPDDNQQQLVLLRQRVQRLEAFINGLLAYSRIGRTEVATETVDVSQLLAEILDSLAPPPTFSIDIQSSLPIFLGKRFLLSQVFANLISNAIKHQTRPDGHIKILAGENGDRYQFAVTDNGPGIAPEYHAKIFEVFQTLDARDTKESTGIGLAIVKKIVETEGGEIVLESQLERGATFRFTWLK